MLTGIYPGSFDPPTLGHIDIMGRAVKIVDRLIIAVSNNTRKQTMFPVGERVAMLMENAPDANVEIKSFDTLLMTMVAQYRAQIVIRGLRTTADFDYEAQMLAMNRKLGQDVETVFLMAAPDHQAISSRLVKEIAGLGGDVAPFVPDNVRRRLRERCQGRKT